MLLTVFISETVYAGSMMMAATNASSESVHQAVSNDAAHCQHIQSKHEKATEKQNTHASCDHCLHCLACVSMLPQARFKLVSSKMQMVTNTAFVQIYHAPDRAQPQKPPIS